jgi:hypothetical protein
VSCWGYFQGVKVMAQWAAMLGKTADADDYNALVDSVRASWAGKHDDALASTMRSEKPPQGKRDWVQTLNALGLDMQAFGNSSSSNSAAAVRAIVSDVAAHGGHFQTGIIGTKYLLRSLSLNGRADVAWRVVSTATFPGYGYMYVCLLLRFRIVWGTLRLLLVALRLCDLRGPWPPAFRISQGATSLWENWQGTRFQPGGSISQAGSSWNHIM